MQWRPIVYVISDGSIYYYYYYYSFMALWILSKTTRESWYQKAKTRKVKSNLDLLEQEIVSSSGISRAICKSAPRPDR